MSFARPLLRAVARPQVLAPIRGAARRTYSSAPAAKSNGGLYAGLAAAAAAGGAGYYLYTQGQLGPLNDKIARPTIFKPTFEDYQKVYNDIAEILEDNDFDDGSYGPILLRLGWHASGTYDKDTKTGGSNGATMRFAPESDHGANAGLKVARDRIESVKAKHPWISYSDLWILGAVCAIQEMGGPKIPYRPGRSDKDVAACTPDGRLPDAAQAQDHLRNIFYRMGFNDQEIVALAGAHALGRCHKDRSGYDGPWTFSPTMLTNDFYQLLLNEKWNWKKWNGPKQYEDKKTKSLMMLPADMALVNDKAFRKYVEIYAKDQDAFFKDFSAVCVKLFELGVPFAEGQESWTFKATTD
ncbi:heme peroxidase [Pyronema domesticum]|uniref:Peroxidase n=1 Tax=Pyronema omphalodes (strain CBS 100304) TaxID=1076935 RepID=U4LUC0_PYROM|nr:heme peroxidase [Pyronema domesticum]CCX33570.1 Similar to Cytochrome c peroxidase, mitochondrial; acc. no. Q7SDV9 [Pyronema omphalodes CBS 100304]